MTAATITATSLRVRSAPSIDPANILATLRHGETVTVLEQTNPTWWRVMAQNQGRSVTGFSAARYLDLNSQAPRVSVSGLQPVHMPSNARARRGSTAARAFPLSETTPTRDPAKPRDEKINAIHRIVETLDVEHSARYLPKNGATFCNIYAYDFCNAANAYLPRVWWTSKAIVDLVAGKAVAVDYGKTVSELSANALHDWLDEWGTDSTFGWTRVRDLSMLQERVNDGGVGIVCALRSNRQRSGHITCVVPEIPGLSAERSGPNVTGPLQSQAGTNNKRYFANAWWLRFPHNYADVGFWIHE